MKLVSILVRLFPFISVSVSLCTASYIDTYTYRIGIGRFAPAAALRTSTRESKPNVEDLLKKDDKIKIKEPEPRSDADSAPISIPSVDPAPLPVLTAVPIPPSPVPVPDVSIIPSIPSIPLPSAEPYESAEPSIPPLEPSPGASSKPRQLNKGGRSNAVIGQIVAGVMVPLVAAVAFGIALFQWRRNGSSDVREMLSSVYAGSVISDDDNDSYDYDGLDPDVAPHFARQSREDSIPL